MPLGGFKFDLSALSIKFGHLDLHKKKLFTFFCLFKIKLLILNMIVPSSVCLFIGLL